MLNITTFNKAKISDCDFKQIECLIKEINIIICDYFSISNTAIVDFSLVNDNEIRKINLKYRNKNKTTDVISVCLWENNTNITKLLGEIFMNINQIKKQANEYGYFWQKEFTRMFIHSVLHLFDFDHEKNKCEEYVVESIQNYLTEKVMKKISGK